MSGPDTVKLQCRYIARKSEHEVTAPHIMSQSVLLPSVVNQTQILILSENKLSGRLPAWLGELQTLQHVDLRGNFLEGPVPPSLAELPHLDTLLLDQNSLDGASSNECPFVHGVVSGPFAQSMSIGRRRKIKNNNSRLRYHHRAFGRLVWCLDYPWRDRSHPRGEQSSTSQFESTQ